MMHQISRREYERLDCYQNPTPTCTKIKRTKSCNVTISSSLLIAAFAILCGSSITLVDAFTQTSHSHAGVIHYQKLSSVCDHSIFRLQQGRKKYNCSTGIQSKLCTPLMNSATSSISTEGEKSLVNDFTPVTMSLTQSMFFFVKYLFIHNKENRIKRRLSRPNGIRSKLWPSTGNIEDLNVRDRKRVIEEFHRDQLEQRPLMETMKMLYKQGQELVELVGFDGKLLISCFGFAALAAFMNSVIPHYYGQSVNCLANAMTTSRPEIIKALTGLGTASVLCALFTGIRGALFWLAGSRANYNIRVKLHRNLLLQEAAFFDSTETGILLSRLNNDVNKIGMVISFHVNVVFRQFAQLIFGAVYLFKISEKLSWFAFGGIGLVAIVSAIYGEFSRVLAERVQNMFADASAVAEKSFSMSETVRAFDGVKSETERYETAQFKALELEEVQAWAYGSHKFISDSLQTALQGILLLSCWSFGRSNQLPVAKLTTFMFYVNFVLESSNEVGDQWAKIQSAIGASSNVFDLIRRLPKIRDPADLQETLSEHYKPSNGNAIGEAKDERNSTPVIEVKDMTVTYGAMEAPALDRINLDIYQGDRIAIVGRSGSGKSSLLRTLLRFYDPVSGSCNLEGTSLTLISRKDLASRISVVEQEPHLFPMSLMDNVLYGIEKDAFDEELEEPTYNSEWRQAVSEALEVAGLPVDGAFKNSMGLELDTRVGEGGRTLSGGQRQRVAIARALIRKPEVLLLDEPTAALDSESEKKVVEALGNAMKKTKCMLMVTHRLGVIRSLSVNKVVVLDRGRVAEFGDPEILLNQNGIYSQLAREQGILPLEPRNDINKVSI